MTPVSAIYLRVPNWIGDVCMSLPSLDAVLATGVPVVVCARGWARDLLAGYGLAGFIEMKGAGEKTAQLCIPFARKPPMPTHAACCCLTHFPAPWFSALLAYLVRDIGMTAAA